MKNAVRRINYFSLEKIEKRFQPLDSASYTAYLAGCKRGAINFTKTNDYLSNSGSQRSFSECHCKTYILGGVVCNVSLSNVARNRLAHELPSKQLRFLPHHGG